MQSILSILRNVNTFLWSGPLLFLLMGTHLYFTMKLHFPQKKIFYAIRLSLLPDKEAKNGSLSAFGALATTLAATLGTGNIVGVSTAVALGGPGAIFWCWITGILGMATAYSECYLSVLFKSRTREGLCLGGPMYVWENGLHNKSIGKLYAALTLLAAFGVGCSTQANALSSTAYTSFRISPHLSGFLAALLTGFIIVGGIKTIGNVCTKFVPFLALLYMASCFILLFLNRDAILPAIELILLHALAPNSIGGGLAGGSLILTARYGIARGLFTNEAGIGTAAIAAAASDSVSPAKQAYVSMTAVFWDTVVMCLLSGLVIVTNMLKHPESLAGVNDGALTDMAFRYLPFAGQEFLSLCLIAFAITTLIGWSYLGESATTYLSGSKGIFAYKVAYIVMIYVGAVMPLNIVWECTDFINALMIFPSITALFLLRKHIRE
ncbi:MAG: sodium:alanine symporter family protein [Lachnospiraceae bacterium]|nr:sodium:alanine symporter family protein [Lachnospiraceae bacterium]